MKLSGRVAIVSGASGAIGSATVRALAGEGAKIVCAAPDDGLLAALAEEARASGWDARAIPTDITDRAQIDALVEATMAAYGRVDVLINLAGVGSSPSLLDSTDREIETVLAVNLLGAARLIHAVLPIMKAQGSGSIVNVGSIAGEVGVMGIYSASKFGLRGLTDSVRREAHSLGVGVTLIEPGFVRSPMNAAMGDNLPSPDIVARAIVASIEEPRRRRIVPWTYRLPVFLAKTLPGMFDRVFGDPRIQERLNRDARAERKLRES